MCNGSEHDKGLQHDLERLLARRKMLKVTAGAAAVGFVSGCDWLPSPTNAQQEKSAHAANGSQCVVHPFETAGPFPADGSNSAHGTLANVLADSGVQRRDIRFDLGQNKNPAAGERLELQLTLVNVNKACQPLEGYAVYLWHCDAVGDYSIYNNEQHTYLRGVGVSSGDGSIAFTTIVPGCYAGRFPHMHFEVYPSLETATDYKNRILTSQLAIPGETCRAVYGRNNAYGASVENLKRTPPLEKDGIFRDNTPKQIAAQTLRIGTTNDGAIRGDVIIGLDV